MGPPISPSKSPKGGAKRGRPTRLSLGQGPSSPSNRTVFSGSTVLTGPLKDVLLRSIGPAPEFPGLDFSGPPSKNGGPFTNRAGEFFRGVHRPRVSIVLAH